MHLLALDIGTRRTGCAFCDTSNGIPLALDTIHHTTSKSLVEAISRLVQDRKIDRILVGNPLLLSGKEGSQALKVREIADLLSASRFSVKLVDERYTTPQGRHLDGDASAACTLLLTEIEKFGG